MTLWYFCRLQIHSSAEQKQEVAAPVSISSVPEGMKRSLLQTGSGSELNPTLECEGCPSTDTRLRVSDSTQYHGLLSGWSQEARAQARAQPSASRSFGNYSVCLHWFA